MRPFSGVPIVVSAHNIESQIWQRYYETESSPVKRAYIHHQWKKFERFERWAFGRADQVVFVSEQDADLGRCDFGATRPFVVDNGVDIDGFPPVFEGRDRYQMLMMGSLDWRPNIDGISYFLKSVYPKLRLAEPRLRLVIIGRQPEPAWAAWVRSHPGVELQANVPEVRPYVEQAGCLVVPLRVGGGSRLKILEAAASGLPVVSTRVGAEGLALESGVHYWGAESIESLEAPLQSLLGHPEEARLIAQAAREVVVARYSWDRLARRLGTCWEANARVAHGVATT